MNVLENMLMQRLLASISDKPITPEEVMATKKCLEAVPGIDPARCRGLIIMAAIDEKNEDGRTGVQLITSMGGSEQTIDALVGTAELLLRVQHMQRGHPEEVAKNPLLRELLEGSEMQADLAQDLFGGCGDPRH